MGFQDPGRTVGSLPYYHSDCLPKVLSECQNGKDDVTSVEVDKVPADRKSSDIPQTVVIAAQAFYSYALSSLD
jgi:hypothetical protein